MCTVPPNWRRLCHPTWLTAAAQTWMICVPVIIGNRELNRFTTGWCLTSGSRIPGIWSARWIGVCAAACGRSTGRKGRLPRGGTICGYEVSPSATSASGAVAARGIGDCGLPGPRRGPAQFLLGTPRPEDIDRDQAAFQSDGLTNRRMRARMSGGVGGEGASPIPTRSRHLLARTWRLPEGGLGWLPSASRARPEAGLRLTLPRSCFLSRWRGNWR